MAGMLPVYHWALATSGDLRPLLAETPPAWGDVSPRRRLIRSEMQCGCAALLALACGMRRAWAPGERETEGCDGDATKTCGATALAGGRADECRAGRWRRHRNSASPADDPAAARQRP